MCHVKHRTTLFLVRGEVWRGWKGKVFIGCEVLDEVRGGGRPSGGSSEVGFPLKGRRFADLNGHRKVGGL